MDNSDFNILIKEAVQRLDEYAGRHLPIAGIAYDIANIVKDKFQDAFIYKSGEGVSFKIFRFTDRSIWAKEMQDLNSVVVYFFICPDDVSIEDYKAKLKMNGYLNNYYDTRFKDIIVSFVVYSRVSVGGVFFNSTLLPTLNHELMHAYTHGRGRNESDKYRSAYAKSLSNLDLFDDNEKNVIYKYIRAIISRIFYTFSKSESMSHMQEIWSELAYNDSLDECPTYIDIKKEIERYKDLKKYYSSKWLGPDVKEFVDNEVVRQMGIPSSYYFRVIDNGIKYVNTRIGKIKAMVNDTEDDKSNNGFKSYVNSEVPSQSPYVKRNEKRNWSSFAKKLSSKLGL